MPLRDHVQLCLREMARAALLTAEEEVDLAKRYEAGLEAERLLAERKRIAAGRKRQLNQVDRDGKRAKERLVQANLRLVVSVAKRYQGRSEEHTSELQSRQYLVCRLLLEKKEHPH